MAVKSIGSLNNQFAGPDGEYLDITDVKEGATYHVVTTGKKLVYHDGGWIEDLRDVYAIQKAAT